MTKGRESGSSRTTPRLGRRAFLAATGAVGAGLAIGRPAAAVPSGAGTSGPGVAAITGTIGQRTGGGNFLNNTTPADRYTLLNDLRASWARLNWYPNLYYRNGSPSPGAVDAAVLLALQRNKSIHAYFELYHDYTTPPRDADTWYRVGHAFATRFRPGSQFLRDHNIPDRGIESWAAMNEPDAPRGGGITATQYRNVLQGLADGIHDAHASARVYPGGLLCANRDREYTAYGRVPAIANLLNQGHLAGIDLHTYNDVQFAPIHDRYSHTTQHDFDAIKQASGITRDIELIVTEHNYKDANVGQGYDNSWAAKYFHPHLWDQLGVVGNNGTSVTRFAMYWSLFREGAGYLYGTNSVNPVSYRVTGSVYKRILTVVHDMSIVRATPKGTGEYVLEGGGKKVWVFQNIHPSWSDIYADTYPVTGIPSGVSTLEIWNHNGLLTTVPTGGSSSVRVSTPTGQTYLILARP